MLFELASFSKKPPISYLLVSMVRMVVKMFMRMVRMAVSSVSNLSFSYD